MPEKILFFDIDRTIFDTETSSERIIKSVSKVSHTTFGEVKRITNEYLNKLEFSTDFDPNGLLRAITNETGTNLDLLNQAMFQPDNFVLYPESLKILTELNKRGFSLGIFSEGVLSWQMEKITLTKIIDYITPSRVIIERRKLSPTSVDKLPIEATVIDDKRYVVEKLKQLRHDLSLVWINRKDSETIDGIKTIKDLNGLI